jgi:hypothetical protein
VVPPPLSHPTSLGQHAHVSAIPFQTFVIAASVWTCNRTEWGRSKLMMVLDFCE